MSLAELLPAARALSRADQVQLVRTLADELLLEDVFPQANGAAISVWSQWDAHAAALDIARLLEAAQASQK
jgi:hypothetical protein